MKMKIFMFNHRITYFDNLKLFLIFFIVFGHVLDRVDKNVPLSVINNFVYSFHMYLFAYVSGVFSTSFTDKTKLLKFTLNFFGLYLIMTLVTYLLALNTSYIDLEELHLLRPYAFLWYLLSLVYWRIIIFLTHGLIARKPKTILFLVTLACILLGSLVDYTWPFALSASLRYFPFFVAGYLIGAQRTTELIQKIPWNVVILTTLLSAFSLWLLNDYNQEIRTILLGNMTLTYMTSDPTISEILKTLLFIAFIEIIVVINSIFVLKAVTNRGNILTNLGQLTLFVYLLHPFFILYLKSWLVSLSSNLWAINLIIYIALSATIFTLLMLLQIAFINFRDRVVSKSSKILDATT